MAGEPDGRGPAPLAEGEEGALEGVPPEERPEGAAEGEAAPSADAGTGDSGTTPG